MQINKRFKTEKVPFKDLEMGDVLRVDGEDYIKIEDGSCMPAALHLEDWKIYNFPNHYPDDCVECPYDNDASSIELKGV